MNGADCEHRDYAPEQSNLNDRSLVKEVRDGHRQNDAGCTDEVTHVNLPPLRGYDVLIIMAINNGGCWQNTGTFSGVFGEGGRGCLHSGEFR